MDFATQFARDVKAYFDRIPLNVWKDFETNLVPGRTWNEDDILRSSILKYGLDDDGLLQQANRNPVFRLEVTSKDYGGKVTETLTGADLAIVFRTMFNNKVMSRRLILVQLKRAYYKGGKTTFDELHHESGKLYFGKDLHQAKRLLLFTTSPIYWFAMSSGVLADTSAFSVFAKRNSLKERGSNDSRYQSVAEISSQAGVFSDYWTLSGNNGKSASSLTPEELIDLVERGHYGYPLYVNYRDLRNISRLKKLVVSIEEQAPYHYLRELRGRFREYSEHNFGMPSCIGTFVTTAETVLSLAPTNDVSFKSVYADSIPFSEFMLKNVLSNDFGDSDDTIIDAVLGDDPKRLLLQRLKKIAPAFDLAMASNLEEIPAVYKTLVVTQHVNTLAQGEQ